MIFVAIAVCFVLAAGASAWAGYHFGWTAGYDEGYHDADSDTVAAANCQHRWEKIGQNSYGGGEYQCMVCGEKQYE